MQRSDLDALRDAATRCFQANGWALPPNPKWDITDFGLGDWKRYGLVLVNLADEPEYCEKLMYAKEGMTTPMHHHRVKKEDIICRKGELAIQFGGTPAETISIKLNGHLQTIQAGTQVNLAAGERVTLFPGTKHEFFPVSEECIIGEVSTANDDVNDNYFENPQVGRFPTVK